jgi:hypothetical protein
MSLLSAVTSAHSVLESKASVKNIWTSLTELRGRVVNTPASYLGDPGFKFGLETWQPEVLRDFPQCLQATTVVVLWLINHVNGVRRLRTAATNGPIVHPQVIRERGAPWWWWWCRLGKTPDSSTRALLQFYLQTYLGASRRNGRRSENFAYRYLRYVNGSLTCRKILRHGASGVLRIFIVIKNPSPRPCLHTRPLDPMVCTLTATPPRRPS